ncbi:glutathione S-transferase [Coniochaeta sp. PMI_546]|nr:glutathione S-transferase [Coniochaeta sp. PMI_546]
MTQRGRPTLIHLQHSSSQMVIWALEEIGMQYDIRKYLRPGLAPAALKETHPQGKAPQLIKADGRVLTQLPAIVLYLRETYDNGHRIYHPETTDDAVREEQLVGIAGDIVNKVGSKLMFHGMSSLAPFFVRPVLNMVRRKADGLVLDPDIKAVFQVLEAELGDREWFMGGDVPSRADIVLRFGVDMTAQCKYVDLGEYPKLNAWLARCNRREAWKRSLEKGNGYDLDWPSRW